MRLLTPSQRLEGCCSVMTKQNIESSSSKFAAMELKLLIKQLEYTLKLDLLMPYTIMHLC